MKLYLLKHLVKVKIVCFCQCLCCTAVATLLCFINTMRYTESDITVTNSLFSSWRSALWAQLPGHRVPILRATVGPGDRRDAMRAEWHISLCGGKVYGRPPYKTSQRDCCFVVTSIMRSRAFSAQSCFFCFNSWPRCSFVQVVVWWSVSIYRLYLSADLN